MRTESTVSAVNIRVEIPIINIKVRRKKSFRFLFICFAYDIQEYREKQRQPNERPGLHLSHLKVSKYDKFYNICVIWEVEGITM